MIMIAPSVELGLTDVAMHEGSMVEQLDAVGHDDEEKYSQWLVQQRHLQLNLTPTSHHNRYCCQWIDLPRQPVVAHHQQQQQQRVDVPYVLTSNTNM